MFKRKVKKLKQLVEVGGQSCCWGLTYQKYMQYQISKSLNFALEVKQFVLRSTNLGGKML